MAAVIRHESNLNWVWTSEREKISLFVMLLSEDWGKTNKVSRGSRRSSAWGGSPWRWEKPEGTREENKGGKKGANVRDIRVQLYPHGIIFENYLSSCLWLKKKKILQHDNGVSKHSCSHAASCAGWGWKSCACQTKTGTTGSSIIFDETLQRALIMCIFFFFFSGGLRWGVLCPAADVCMAVKKKKIIKNLRKPLKQTFHSFVPSLCPTSCPAASILRRIALGSGIQHKHKSCMFFLLLLLPGGVLSSHWGNK